MRAAFIVSAVLHLSILAAALFSLPNAESFSTPAVVALPVDLVTIADETDITEGEVEAEAVVENAAPETVEAPEPALPDETPGATGEEANEIATNEDARVEAAESTAPEPEAAPEPEPAPEEAPEAETPPEQEVAALDPQEIAPQEEAEARPAPVPETVVPSRKPPAPRRPQRARVEQASEDAFDADRVSQLINRSDPSGGGSGSAQASLGSATGRAAAQLTLSEMDALRAQMQRCWNPPIGLANGEDLVITVNVRLAPDGFVVNIDQVGAVNVGRIYDVAADAARRAVLQCQPYRLPVDKYEAWKDVQVNFDPRELF